jgi:hypothetical protein
MQLSAGGDQPQQLKKKHNNGNANFNGGSQQPRVQQYQPQVQQQQPQVRQNNAKHKNARQCQSGDAAACGN